MFGIGQTSKIQQSFCGSIGLPSAKTAIKISLAAVGLAALSSAVAMATSRSFSAFQPISGDAYDSLSMKLDETLKSVTNLTDIVKNASEEKSSSVISIYFKSFFLPGCASYTAIIINTFQRRFFIR